MAEAVRQERTGIHARVSIALNRVYLAWSTFNVERDEDRTRLCNSAMAHTGEAVSDTYPKIALKHDLDLFCRGIWPAWVSRYTPTPVSPDPSMPAIEFVLYPYVVKGGGTILFAPPGRGKSYFALAMALCIDAGAGLWSPPRRKALFINLERSGRSVQRRLTDLCGALGIEKSLLCLHARGRSLNDVYESARKCVREEGVEVIFLDSISRSGFGDLTENAPVNRIIDGLNRLAETWVALGHTPRATEDHLYGSVHFDAGADVVVRMATQRQSSGSLGIGLDITKANDFAPPPMGLFALEFSQDRLTVVRQAQRSEFPELAEKASNTLVDEIEDYLLDVGNTTATLVAQALGRNRSTVASVLSANERFVKLHRDKSGTWYGVRSHP